MHIKRLFSWYRAAVPKAKAVNIVAGTICGRERPHSARDLCALETYYMRKVILAATMLASALAFASAADAYPRHRVYHHHPVMHHPIHHGPMRRR